MLTISVLCGALHCVRFWPAAAAGRRGRRRQSGPMRCNGGVGGPNTPGDGLETLPAGEFVRQLLQGGKQRVGVGSGRITDDRFRLWLQARGGVTWDKGGKGAVTDDFRALVHALPPTPLVRGPIQVNPRLNAQALWWWHVQICERCKGQEGGDPDCEATVPVHMWGHGIPLPLVRVPAVDQGGKDYDAESEDKMTEDLQRLASEGKVILHDGRQDDVLYLPRFEVLTQSWKQDVWMEGEDEVVGSEEEGTWALWHRVEKVRPVVDCRPANLCGWLTALQYPDPMEVFRWMPEGAHMVVVDISAAYHQYCTPAMFHKCFGVASGGLYGVWKAVVFGAAAAPGSVCLQTAVIFDILKRHTEAATGTVWLDDYWLAYPSYAEAWVALQKTGRILNDIGIPFGAEKVQGPTQLATFIGLRVDSRRMTLSIPEEKVVAAREELQRQLKAPDLHAREVLRLLGRLQWIARIAIPWRALLRSVWHASPSLKALLRAVRRRDKKYLRLGAADVELVKEVWRELLGAIEEKQLQCVNLREWDPESFDEVVESDGGEVAWGVVGQGWVAWGGPEWPEWRRCSSTFRELWPVACVVQAMAERWKDKQVIWILDSQAAVGALTKMSSPRPALNMLLQIVGRVMQRFRLRVFAVWRGRAGNGEADAYSRCASLVDAAAVCARYDSETGQHRELFEVRSGSELGGRAVARELAGAGGACN